MSDFLSLSNARYTTKHYDRNKKVSKDNLMTLLSILRNTPSSLNMQPWHFLILDNQVDAQKILPAIDGFNHERIIDSSYSIIFCSKSPLTPEDAKHVIEKEALDGRFSSEQMKEDRLKHLQAKLFDSNLTPNLQHWQNQQVYIALGCFLYAAESLHIDTTAIGGFNSEKLDECLNLKEKNLSSVVIATIGYHSENDSNANRPKSRLNFDEIFTFI